MAVTQIEQRSRIGNRQINRSAVRDLVEIHIAAKGSRVPGRRRSASRARSSSNTAQHWAERDGKVLQVLRGGLRGRGIVCQVQMPLDGTSVIPRLDGKLWTKRCLHQSVVATRPVAVEAESINPNEQRIARHRSFDIERTSLRIPAGDALHAPFIA